MVKAFLMGLRCWGFTTTALIAMLMLGCWDVDVGMLGFSLGCWCWNVGLLGCWCWGFTTTALIGMLMLGYWCWDVDVGMLMLGCWCWDVDVGMLIGMLMLGCWCWCFTTTALNRIQSCNFISKYRTKTDHVEYLQTNHDLIYSFHKWYSPHKPMQLSFCSEHYI